MTPRALGLLRPFYLVCLLTLVCLAPTRAAPRESIDVVVLLDNSGSMARQGTLPGNDEGFMRVTAVQYLLEKMAPGDRIALVTFASVIHLNPTEDPVRPNRFTETLPASGSVGARHLAIQCFRSGKGRGERVARTPCGGCLTQARKLEACEEHL